MKLLDLFSGIGGFSLAARWTGRIETTAFCETDPYCRKVLEKNFPGVPIHGDIRNLRGIDVGATDIISGGFPCQPFSVAGKRGGASDDRYLWPEMLRVISDVWPTWVLGENVAGLVRMGVQSGIPEVASRNLERTEDFDRLRGIFTREEILLLFSFLDDLEALGYGAVPLVIPACGVDAPHLRYRVWIVAYAGEGGRAGTRKDLCRHKDGFAPPRNIIGGCRKDVADAEVGTVRAGLRPGEPGGVGRGRPGDGSCEDVPYSDRPRCGELRGSVSVAEEHPPSQRRGGWLPEPAICRVADGVPARVDRLRSLGNAIVPQVAYEILMGILKAEGL